MILTWLGRSALDVAFVSCVIGVVSQVTTLRGRRSRALLWGVLALAGLVAAVAVMQFALITHNFSLAYVAENNATFTPLIYSITGMWSALEGSLLLWALILTSLTVGVIHHYRRDANDAVVVWATLVLFVVGGFFILLMVGPADPFLHNPAHVLQGAGPNALLQDNPLVAVHPPLLYAGFVGFSVPFAFAIAMLVTGRVHDRWPLEQRRWTVLAWGCLSVGIVLGAWWSYQVLGWGGFWGWDPVENAALLPWLTATAIATFAFTVLGTFFTRSGVLQSVHSFSSSTLGPALITFFAITVGAGVALIAWRGDELRSPVGVDHPASREGLFVANNILFVGFAFVVLLGTVFPLLYEAVNGTQVTVGTPYFAAVAAPVAVALLFLMAIAPVVSWRTVDAVVLWQRVRISAWVALASVVVLVAFHVRHWSVLVAVFLSVAAAGAALRTLKGVVQSARRRGDLASAWRAPSTGGMIVHLGVVVLAVGIVVSTSYTTRSEVTLSKNQRTVVDGQYITFGGFAAVATPLEKQTQLKVTVDGNALRPAITTFNGRTSQPVGTPAIDSNLLRDVYVTFDAVGGNGITSGGQLTSNLPAGSVLLGVTVEPLLFGRRRHRDEVAT
jgi:cytochrome c-type biogenesis protein CcmF